MKRSALVILLFLFTFSAYSQQSRTADFRKLRWLAGNWVRTNDKAGNVTTEGWEVISKQKLSGYGLTLRGADTVFAEHMDFLIKGKDIFYVVTAPNEPDAVWFKLTAVTNDSFVCENPEHDFPKKIMYQLTDGTIKATISGDGQQAVFLFVRKD